MSKEESYTEIFFSEGDDSMTVNWFDKNSEMTIVIRNADRKQAAIYSMTVWEAKQLVYFIKGHIKNQTA